MKKRTIGGVLAGLFGIGLLSFLWLWWAPCWMGGCAPIEEMAGFQAEGSELLDIHGEAFGTLASVNRRVVPLDSMPDQLVQAFLAIEDRRFYSHNGVDPVRFGGALTTLLRPGRAEGGSTITMQLARNLFPDHLPYTDRGPVRKLREIRVARQIERSFRKDKILELYINHIYLGSGAYGVEAASLAYFGKPAAELSLAEAALIGGLPKAPSLLDPTRNRQGATERRNLVLREMADAGFITAAEAESARQEPVRLAPRGTNVGSPRGSYFIERVRQELEEVVGRRFYTAGLKIYTTLDAGLQTAAEEEIGRQLDAIEAGRFGRFPHGDTYPEMRGVAAETGESPYLQGAVILMDAQNGEIRAMVGGRDYQDSKFDRATLAQRQPGSAYKPFVYLAALDRYRSPVHIVEDSPLRLTLGGGRPWEPRNYTGEFSGPMTMRDALARSKNVPTVRLAMDVGIERVNDQARRMGVTSDLPNMPSVALGAAEVRPIELAEAYAPLANGGQGVRPHMIRRIEDRSGLVMWEAPRETRRVLDPELAFVMTSMLRDVVDRGTGTAVRASGYAAPAAGKTGTTNDATDVWFVGYTPDLVGVVWIGFDNPKTIIRGASGGALAAPVWSRIMQKAPASRSEWRQPSGVVTAEVERGTGRVVSEMCPANGPTYTEYFVRVRPAAASCPRSTAPMIASADTLWGDEEWGSDLPQPASEGVDWPALEEMRRQRADGASPTAPLPGSVGVPEQSRPDDPLGRPTPPRPTAARPAPGQGGTRPTQPPAAEPEPEERTEPRVLGRPVERPPTPPVDSAAVGGR
jgi:penicillin-binding protein 1A